MNRHSWSGVMPAITTPFTASMDIDLKFLRTHLALLVKEGATGIVTPGSLGEGSVLPLPEKVAIWKTCVEELGNTPTIAAIASASTSDAISLAKAAKAAGCRGLMVLPPYIYKGSWREMGAHFSAVIEATDLSCMLYNNPIAYGTDVLPTQIAELARAHANLHAVKESSGDIRRMAAIREIIGDRLALFVGVDDMIVEGIAAGAVGWIAGVVNALPRESVAIFNLAREGKTREADAIYRWSLPLMRMDTTYDFVQLIKLIQQECGVVGDGGARVRLPRMMPEGKELDTARLVIRHALATRPKV